MYMPESQALRLICVIGDIAFESVFPPLPLPLPSLLRSHLLHHDRRVAHAIGPGADGQVLHDHATLQVDYGHFRHRVTSNDALSARNANPCGR